MVRRRSTVRFRKGARGGTSAAGRRPRGGVAQSVEQAAHNRCVAGSSPASATTRPPPADSAVRSATLPPTAPTHRRRSRKALPWPPPTSVRRSRWPARSASTATTSPRRTVATTPTGIELKKFCPNCRCTRRTARRARLTGGRPDRSSAGRCRPRAPYLVGREKIREFALAIGDDYPRAMTRGRAAPPGIRTWSPRRRSRCRSPRRDPARSSATRHSAGLLAVVHGDQRFMLHRPSTAATSSSPPSTSRTSPRGRARHADAALRRSTRRRAGGHHQGRAGDPLPRDVMPAEAG